MSGFETQERVTKRQLTQHSNDSGLRPVNALTLNSPAALATNCVLIGQFANRASGSRQMFPHGTPRGRLSATVRGCRDKLPCQVAKSVEIWPQQPCWTP